MASKILGPDGNPILRDGKEIFSTDLVGSVKGVNLLDRSMDMIGTDETKDRDGDIIKVAGWQLENYRKNPVFLWAHHYGSVPLARADKITRRRDPVRMDFHLTYPTKGLHPFADMILELYGQKIINASSVGFIPFKWDSMPPDDKDTENQRRTYGRIFTSQELLELSGCAVPSNPSALQNSLVGNPDFLKQFGFDLLAVTKWVMGDVLLLPKPTKIDDILGEIEGKVLEIIDETTPIIVQVPDQVIPTPLPIIEDKKREIKVTDAVMGEFIITEEEFIDKELALKPYPNEHACRLANPDQFDQFARKNCYRKVDGKCVDYIFGIISADKSKLQALRFKKDVWTAGNARKVCEGAGGSFEAASSSAIDLEDSVTSISTEVQKIKESLSALCDSVKALETKMGQASANVPIPGEKSKGVAEAILSDAFKRIGSVQPPPPAAKNILPESGVKLLMEEIKKLKSALDEAKKFQK